MLKIRENTSAVFLAGFRDNLQPVSIPSAMKKNGRAQNTALKTHTGLETKYWYIGKSAVRPLSQKKSTAIMLYPLGK